jgi:penicillin-binding protein 2
MDPRDGQLLAMGSYPTFDPSIFTKPITEKRYKALVGASEDDGPGPLFNRAISGGYPTASTMKAITALAGLDVGLITPGTTIDDAGCIKVGEIDRCNAREQAYGPVDLARAIQVSSDVYFYQLGINAYYRGDEPGKALIIQRWARKLGLDRPTGIDLPGDIVGGGTIPDPKWRDEINAFEVACRKRKKIPLGATGAQAALAGCGRSDLRDYNLGDTVNLAIGQGDVQASPLQMAIAYAAIENGGKIVQPHLGLEIESPAGELVQRIEREPERKVKIARGNLDVVREGLRLAASEPGGTSYDVFAGWNHAAYPVFGKTGTAQTAKGDQSWYIAFVPDATRPIVVAVTVERGGFGAAVAAPIACRILAKYYKQDPSACAAGAATAR